MFCVCDKKRKGNGILLFSGSVEGRKWLFVFVNYVGEHKTTTEVFYLRARGQGQCEAMEK